MKHRLTFSHFHFHTCAPLFPYPIHLTLARMAVSAVPLTESCQICTVLQQWWALTLCPSSVPCYATLWQRRHYVRILFIMLCKAHVHGEWNNSPNLRIFESFSFGIFWARQGKARQGKAKQGQIASFPYQWIPQSLGFSKTREAIFLVILSYGPPPQGWMKKDS